MNQTKRRHTKRRHTKRRQTKKMTNKVFTLSPKIFREYDILSPFELKNKLISMTTKNTSFLKNSFLNASFLNAGRGNPNFFNTFVRMVFAKLQLIVTNASPKLSDTLSVWPLENEMNYTNFFMKELRKSSVVSWSKEERDFLSAYLKYLIKRTKVNGSFNVNTVMHDLFLSTLGCFYPSPPQIQPSLELVANDFLYNLVMSNGGSHDSGKQLKIDDFECFATEGAAAGILYVFNTLKENFILNPGDTIAIITPIFSPYLEIPKLSDYKLKIIELKTNPAKNYTLDIEEINKLKNKKIKALFMVNPANPAGYSLSKDNIDEIGKIVNTERKDLIVLSDNVYAPFADEYNSFMLSCPYNTIEVFSLSKYFGTTGWRLGLCMISKNNVLNKILLNSPTAIKSKLTRRYEIANLEPGKMPFMERLVSDSRQVAEGHVAGLSTPQQVLIGLCLFFDMYDAKVKHSAYKNEIKHILKTRINLLYAPLKTNPNIQPTSTNYYTLINLLDVTENLYGSAARTKLKNKYEYLELLFHLAKKYNTILLPGSGFGTDKWSVRASLANLTDKDYSLIGNNIKLCIGDYINVN